MARTTCPYCGTEANTPQEEVQHMEDCHPEIVEQRLRDAGMHTEADKFLEERL
jgi:hypothetical protein